MRDRVLIFSGMVLFLALFTYPVWHGIAAGSTTKEPELKLPASATTCVASQEYMRSSHMQMLIRWREGYVRGHQLGSTAYNGVTYKVSLSKTCLGQCHGSRKEFCDRCHAYTAVSTPYCWDCHQDASAGGATIAVNASAGRLP